MSSSLRIIRKSVAHVLVFHDVFPQGLEKHENFLTSENAAQEKTHNYTAIIKKIRVIIENKQFFFEKY